MATITVLLVDDDALVLDDMVTMVDWEACGFKVVGTATNGKQALDLYDRCYPDVLITDINMPVMDGLSLIEQIKHKGGKPHIVIYTSYNEFEYAKRALQSGVADYLLKNELTPTALENKLSGIAQALTENEGTARRSLMAELSDYFDMTRQDDERTIYSKQLQALVDLRLQYFIVSVRNAFCADPSRDTKENETKKLCDRIYKYEPVSCRIPVLFSSKGMVIVGVKRTAHTVDKDQFARQFVRQLSAFLGDTLFERHAFFYSAASMSLSEYRRVIYGLQYIIKFYLYFLPNKPLPVDDLKRLDYYRSDKVIPLNLYTGNDKKHGEEALLSQVHAMFAGRDIDSIIRFFNNICLFFDHLNESIPQNGVYFSNQEDFEGWIVSAYRKYKQINTGKKENGYPGHVRRSLEYMQENYSQANLSADAIAEHVSLSSGRLAVLFKTYTGKTINESLTEIRINKAIDLLQNSNFKIYEIAEMVGYKTPQYFSHIFFQKTNKRPIEYKKNS